MTTTAPDRGTSPGGHAQDRVSENVRYLIGKRRTSGRRLATALGLSSSGMTNRLNGLVKWNVDEVEAVARELHVPWPWLFLTEAELVTKCTAPDLNRQPADSLHEVISRLAAGVAPRATSASSPRAGGVRMGLVRPSFGDGASVPRQAVA